MQVESFYSYYSMLSRLKVSVWLFEKQLFCTEYLNTVSQLPILLAQHAKKTQPLPGFLERGCSKNFAHGRASFQLACFRLKICIFTQKGLYKHCFPNDFVMRLCRATLNACITLSPQMIMWLTKQMSGKQMHEVPISYEITLTLSYIILNMTLLAGQSL